MWDVFTRELVGRGTASFVAFVLGWVSGRLMVRWRRMRQRRLILKGDARDSVVIEHHTVEAASGPDPENPGRTRPVRDILRIRMLGKDELGRVIPNGHLMSRVGPLSASTARAPVVMDFVAGPCYDRPMRAFVCEVDNWGLHGFLPEHLLPAEELTRLARVSCRRSSAVIWALLEETDAEVVRTEVGAGRHHDACDLLLNRAVEILPIAAAVPYPAGSNPVAQ
jgi:hypothetical protein